MLTPAEAYWKQRHALREAAPRLSALQQAVDHLSDLSSYQWAQLTAFALEFRPDLILELGRGLGNSTCVFTEVAHRLSLPAGRVVSLCNTDSWQRRTLPRLRPIVPPDWFAPLRAIQADILTFDYEALLSGAERVFVFWDAHGFAVAECVLGRILPLIQQRAHVVAMHDLSDARYMLPALDQYGGHGLWKGEASIGSGARVRIGHINSEVPQAVAITDFCSRNQVPLESADHSFQCEIGRDPAKVEELRAVVGDRQFSLTGHWFWFSLNDASGPFTFPAFEAPRPGLPLLRAVRRFVPWLGRPS